MEEVAWKVADPGGRGCLEGGGLRWKRLPGRWRTQMEEVAWKVADPDGRGCLEGGGPRVFSRSSLIWILMSMLIVVNIRQ